MFTECTLTFGFQWQGMHLDVEINSGGQVINAVAQVLKAGTANSWFPSLIISGVNSLNIEIRVFQTVL